MSKMILNNQNINIVETFLKDYSKQHTGSEIARKKQLNQKTVSNILRSLEKEGMLISTMQGRNRIYFLNLDNTEVIEFISAVEHMRTLQFYKKQPLVKEIAAKILASSTGIVVIFGSYAKGTEKKDSDLDVFIAGSYDSRKMEKVKEMYGIDISLKHYLVHYFRKALKNNDPFIEEIIKEHIILSGTREFVVLLRGMRYGKD